MEIVKEVIDSYWRERFLLDNNAQQAFQLMDTDFTLTFIGHDDVDWLSISTLQNTHNAHSFSAYYQRFDVEEFKNGVAIVEWTLYPDGRYFMDEDGYGMESNEASVVYGFIDKQAHVVVPFQAKNWKDMEQLRPQAIKKAQELNNGR